MDQDRLNRSHQITFKQTFTLYTINETFSRADYHRVKTHTRNDQQSRCLCPIYAAEQSYAHTTTEVHPFALNPTSQREYLKSASVELERLVVTRMLRSQLIGSEGRRCAARISLTKLYNQS